MRISNFGSSFGRLLLLAVAGLLAEFAPADRALAQPANPADSGEVAFSEDDWLEAGADDQNGTRFRSCTITIGADGMLTGIIFRIDETTRLQTPVKAIELRLVQNGEALEMTTPDEEDGSFTFGPVEPGIYSLIGQGADGLVAYSFHVEAPKIDESKDEEAKIDEAAAPPAAEAAPAEEAENAAPRIRLINSCAMNPVDVPMALQLIEAFLGVNTGAQTDEPVLDEDMEKALREEEQAPDRVEPPVGSEETPAIPDPASPAPATPAPGARRAGSFKFDHHLDEVLTTALSWRAVPLQEDGSLIGRVRILIATDDEDAALQTRPPKDMRIFLLQQGKVIAKSPCSPRGIFMVPDLPVGVYSFVSVGLDGFAAMTLEVLPAEKPKDEQEEKGGVRSASLRRVAFHLAGSSLPNFDTAVVPPGDMGQLLTTPTATPSEVPPQTLADMGPLLSGLNGNTNAGSPGGSGSPFAPGTGGASGVGTAGGGGFGGGVGGGGNGGGNSAVPEIDPASAGVGLSVLIALLFLLIDLYRPRDSATN